MDSMAPECTPLKHTYDACFSKWYSEKFLRGNITRECDELLEKYKGCVIKAMKQKGLEKVVDDARKETGSAFKSPPPPSSSA
ncbi:hypothetical protein GQ42DRAFT_161270 [Ramicandelaber brevisporus]|nr:hypothetical protein GQ42DRAFT_161270 [Ramicandelaber brevisporus]